MIRRPPVLCLVAIAALSLAACASLDITSDWDHAVDFSGFKTFTWLEPAEGSDSDRLPEHLDIRLRRVVEEILIDKGFEPARIFPEADLALTYYVGIRKELKVDVVGTTYYGGYSYGYWPAAAVSTARMSEYSTGSIVLDVVDRKTQQLVWRGVVEGEFQYENPPGERVEHVAGEMLKTFPPKP